MDISTVFAIVGFCLAGYSVVANDAIQTLGTFLASNEKKPWWVLWGFACAILIGVMIYGYVKYTGDVSYGRLENIPFPEGGIQWYHAVPPLAILILTRYGIPVSTTFLVLTIFSTKALEKMLLKSLLGYGVAFLAAVVLYFTVASLLERKFMDSADDKPSNVWVVIQWCSTGFLWSQWLIQDLANIYVFMPRDMGVTTFIITMCYLLGISAIIFYMHGGAIQKIVTSKTNTTDIRSASIVDLIFAVILFYFKNMNSIPMSTTWVFLGLLAGRELALALRLRVRSKTDTSKVIFTDLGKAALGLVVSVVLAFTLAPGGLLNN